jgi:hypothetical protein
MKSNEEQNFFFLLISDLQLKERLKAEKLKNNFD